jgi:hypothetical protein
MSGARILFPDFRDEQGDSRYPFVDTATLLANDRLTTIGRDTFIDATLYVIGAGNHLYISTVIVAPQKITLRIGDERNVNIAETSFVPNPIQTPENDSLTLLDSRGRPAGALIANADKLVLFAGWDIGTYTFTRAATEFVASVCIPAREPGVRGTLTENGNLITGDLWLIGDGGVVLRHEGEQNGYQIIRVDIIGVPLFQRFLCIPFDRFAPKNFVKTINNCPPDEYGNFTLTATGFEVDDTVLRVTNRDGIIFIDAVGRKVV